MAAQRQEVALFTRTALQNTRTIDMIEFTLDCLSKPFTAQILTSCSKMNVKSADIRSISQYTDRGLFYLRMEEKYIYFTSKVLLTEF